jgi:hypothetical protein
MHHLPEKSSALLFFQNNNPLSVFDACHKKGKDCCKKFKKGDRCKKCPGKK